MPNLSGFPALDVAIGLAFIFFLLATACSAVNELIANVLGWRAKTLEDGVRGLLGDRKRGKAASDWGPGGLTDHVFSHWRITTLTSDPNSTKRRRNRPSYMPAAAFSLAVAETLAKGPQPSSEDKTPWETADAEILEKATATLKGAPGFARPLLQKAATNSFGELEHFRANVETGFNDAMERASGWYKRKVTVALVLIAAVFTVGLNVDTPRVASQLWKDPAVRTAVAAKASAASQQTVPQQTAAQGAANDVDQVKQLNLPVGWGSDNRPRKAVDYLKRIPGWLITIAALSLGAPFWFDLLSRVARLRGSGVPEKPRTLSDAARASS